MRNWVTFSFCAAALLTLSCGRSSDTASELMLLCGSSMRAPTEKLAAEFNAEHPTIKVVTTYGGSGELMAQLKNNGRGDIYVCHDPFIDWAVENKIVTQYVTVAVLQPVIVVPKGNPLAIKNLRDLTRPGLRLGFGDERYSSSGVIMDQMLKTLSYGDSVRANMVMSSKGHQERANGVALGSLDAAVVWTSISHVFADKLDTLHLPIDSVDAVSSATYGTTDLRNTRVTIGLTAAGARSKAALEFYRFTAARAPGIYTKFGFLPVPGEQK